MGEAVYAIDDFPADDLFWRIEWIGGVGYNASVPSDPLIDCKFAHYLRTRTSYLRIAEKSFYELESFHQQGQKPRNCMSALLRFIPGSTIRWRARRYVIVDYAGMDAILAGEVGKRRLHRVPLHEAVIDHAPGELNAWTPDLVSVRENAWQTAVKRFKILKPLLERGRTEGSFAGINEIARRLGKHPSTIYRWIDDYERSGRLSVFLRKERSDRGQSRLPDKVNAIIDAAINKIYLKAEQPDVAAAVPSQDR